MDASEIRVSAPGKVILHGEHAVVYGKAAIACSLNLRTSLILRDAGDKEILSLQLPSINVKASWFVSEIQKKFTLPVGDFKNPAPPTEQYLKMLKEFAAHSAENVENKDLALVAFLYLYLVICGQNKSLPSFEVTVLSKLPVSVGLGSSACYSVCLAAAFLQHQGFIQSPNMTEYGEMGLKRWLKEDLDLINTWAFQAECIIHGRPSGIDNSVSTYGGAVTYQNGQMKPFEKMLQMNILLINTKVPRSTKTLVGVVKKYYEKYPDIVVPILDSIEGISKKCIELMNSDLETDQLYSMLEELIDINQCHLTALGVSHLSLQAVCSVLLKFGLHGKLTGAGGGGCVFSLLRPGFSQDCIDAAKAELNSLGYDCWETTLGEVGVKQE